MQKRGFFVPEQCVSVGAKWQYLLKRRVVGSNKFSS